MGWGGGWARQGEGKKTRWEQCQGGLGESCPGECGIDDGLVCQRKRKGCVALRQSVHRGEKPRQACGAGRCRVAAPTASLHSFQCAVVRVQQQHGPLGVHYAVVAHAAQEHFFKD